MYRIVSSAVTVPVAAFGLSGCGGNAPPPAPAPTPVEQAGPPAAPSVPPPPAALPPPSALTDVMYRLTDPAVPGTEKTALIAEPGPADAAALDRFGKALTDNGYHPMTFDATDLAWAPERPGDVLATVIGRTPPDRTGGDFTFPMQFARTPDGGWQLTRDSAEMLLDLDGDTGTGPGRPPR
ncbi:hypothetical protein E4P42_04040 [Mycobacterium sp. PS03-16]|nr:hypothetical protein E4P42_04040 [Mycobacterium sp. PS03-16]